MPHTGQIHLQITDSRVQDILRFFAAEQRKIQDYVPGDVAYGELPPGDTNERSQENQRMARNALMELGVDPNTIQDWLNEAPQLFGAVTPTNGGAIDPTGQNIPGTGDYIVPALAPTAEDEFLATEGGPRASFTDFIQRFRPGSSRFLRRGLQQRFDPMQTAFETQSALGTLPGRGEGQSGQLGSPVNFRQWMENYGGGVPAQGTWQSMLGGVSDWLTGGRPTAGITSMGQSYMVDPQNQFNLALQSIMQNVPYHLRGAAAATAERDFRIFQAQNPGRDSEWLPAWQAQGQRWNPTLGPAITTGTTDQPGPYVPTISNAPYYG